MKSFTLEKTSLVEVSNTLVTVFIGNTKNHMYMQASMVPKSL